MSQSNNPNRHPAAKGMGAPPSREHIRNTQPEETQPKTDQDWRKIAREHGVHAKAERAAQNGRTLMVFLQAEGRSVPYPEYADMLNAGGNPIGNPEPMEVQANPEQIEPTGQTPTELGTTAVSGANDLTSGQQA